MTNTPENLKILTFDRIKWTYLLTTSVIGTCTLITAGFNAYPCIKSGQPIVQIGTPETLPEDYQEYQQWKADLELEADGKRLQAEARKINKALGIK